MIDDTESTSDAEDLRKITPPQVSITASSSTQGSTSASSPRSDYDEGMNCYNRPLRIDTTKSDDYYRTAPTLLFNIGQLNSLEGDDTAAERYFLKA